MSSSNSALSRNLEASASRGFAPNGEILIHYRTFGEGPALLFLHGFPDTEETWSAQVEEFARDHLVITPTLRGYPPSGTPTHVSDYSIPTLVSDIVAVLDHIGVETVTLVGHDWGGGVLQAFALMVPHRVSGLAILNSPIVQTFGRLISHNAEQQELSRYTLPYFHYENGSPKDVDLLTVHIRDPHWRQHIADYLRDSPIEGMMNLYKAGFPAPPYRLADMPTFPVQQVPVLVLWGLDDEYFLPEMLNGTWDAFGASYRIVGIHGAGHWVFRDRPALVNTELRSWMTSLQMGSVSEL